MKFVSTRGRADPVRFCKAVSEGLAPDGGLYLPSEFPDLSSYISEWGEMTYSELCYSFFRLFATDIEDSILKSLVEKSYSQFTHLDIAPVISLDGNLRVMELFHGPTLAFKDFALQLLGNLYEYQIEQSGKPITILGATSGDTGAAAISGLLGKKGVKVFILYPDGKVSPLQERQMTCTGAENIFPLAIEGTFDDAQKSVKEIFVDLSFKEKVGLSAVNSINLARILAQSVYYLYAWLKMNDEERLETIFVVPTGNFGNVFAGWLLTKMNLPIKGFRVATNQNDVLHRLFSCGEYSLSTVSPSLAPSMDIQVASNFERLLYYVLDRNNEKLREIMKIFASNGKYSFEDFSVDSFSSSSVTDSEIPDIIKEVQDKYNYTVDPHTACGFKDLKPADKYLVMATAHPAKFPSVYEKAGLDFPKSEILETLKSKEIIKFHTGTGVREIKKIICEKIGTSIPV
jgi:threonine synthase